MKRPTLEALLAARRQRRPLVLVTELRSGAQQLLDPRQAPAEPSALDLAARRAAQSDRSELIESGDAPGGPWLVQVFNPRLRMVVIGAVHIAQSLVTFARLNGFEVTVIDPRRAFATAERFPSVQLVCAWPDRALAELALDRRCALVTLTHDPKLDDPALAAGLRAGVFYVGALGSRRTHQARRARLLEQGFSEAEVARIRGPVGLDIGAVGAAEIATSIMAEVILTLRRSGA